MNQVGHSYEGWDAHTYHKVSNIQESWAIELLTSKKWEGNEIVLDAGCGSGRVTKILAGLLPKGKIFAVDLDQNMISTAKSTLRDFGNVEFFKTDLTYLELSEKVDVIFSNAVLHWIPDHFRLFSNFKKILRENGELLIQCGGRGNLKDIHRILDIVMRKKEFTEYFHNWVEPWNFASAKDTYEILVKTGFKNINTSLTKKIANFLSAEEYKLFLKTVIMRPYLSHLPGNDIQNIRNNFVDSFLECKLAEDRSPNSSGWDIDYVRLNISALND